MNTEKSLYPFEVDGEVKHIKVDSVYCIGYTGRNKEKTMEHIKELAEIGIPEPLEVPTLFPVRTSSLNQVNKIEVLGGDTSGEAEIVLIFGDSKDDVFLSVGSDHTDRSLEAVDINKSKQVCDKPCASKAWKVDSVISHWDELELSSQVYTNGSWLEYQKNPISSIISLEEIQNYLQNKKVELKNSVIFSGTVPLLNGFKYGDKFKMQLTDPVNSEYIETYYDIKDISVGG